MAKKFTPPYEHLRLRDVIQPGLRILLVGINPGVKSATSGHHFAGPSNRFWKLLYESGLVSEPVSHLDDVRLPEWGMGVTNLVARPSPGIDSLRPREYVEGWRILERKIAKYRPQVIALVGVTLWRAILPLLLDDDAQRRAAAQVKCPGLQKLEIHGAKVFVLPNPSGRNANFTYSEMLNAFRSLRRWTART